MVETGGERNREDGNDEISESQKFGENRLLEDLKSQYLNILKKLVRIAFSNNILVSGAC